MDLKPDLSHVGMFYQTDEEQKKMIASFLREGIESGEKIIYIGDRPNTEDVSTYLRSRLFEIKPYMMSGQLSVVNARETFLREGSFDPGRMIALLREKSEKALSEGYSALRVSGEMSWVLHGISGSDRLIEYEAKLNEFLQSSRGSSLCQYDRRRFPPSILLYVLTTHPVMLIGSEMCENRYFRASPAFLGCDSASVTLSRWLQDLAVTNMPCVA